MKLWIALVLTTLVVSGCGADMKTLDRQIDGVVNGLTKDSEAAEYRKARTTHIVDVDGDGQQDAIVFFTIEGRDGGNNFESYFAVLKGQSSAFLMQDVVQIGGGGLGDPSYELPSIKNGRIIIQRDEYGDEDSRCCPSKKSQIVFILQRSKLVDASKHKAQ